MAGSTRRACAAPGTVLCCVGVLSTVLASSCRRQTEETPVVGSATPDRLEESEVMPGREVVFGLLVPREMRVAARFADSALLVGGISAETASNHFRGLIRSDKPEVGAARTVFPDAQVLAAPEQGTLRIEITGGRQTTKVWLIKPPKAIPPKPGLTDAERWGAAGYNPDGTLKDPLKQY
jgi:hypothetical protein